MDIRGHLAFHVFLYGQSLARSRSNFGSGSSLGIGQKDGISAQCRLWSLSIEFVLLIQDLLAPMLGRLP